MANYTLNFGDAYADCLNVILINLKANADCIEYAFSIIQITLNISMASYSIHIANSNTRICTQSDLSIYSNSFNIAIVQGTLNIGGAANLIHFATFIIQAHSYCSFIANYKALSIYISISCSWISSGIIYSFDSYGISIGFGGNDSKTSSGFITWLYTDYERASTGTSLYDSTPL